MGAQEPEGFSSPPPMAPCPSPCWPSLQHPQPGSGRRQGFSGEVARRFDTWPVYLGRKTCVSFLLALHSVWKLEGFSQAPYSCGLSVTRRCNEVPHWDVLQQHDTRWQEVALPSPRGNRLPPASILTLESPLHLARSLVFGAGPHRQS